MPSATAQDSSAASPAAPGSATSALPGVTELLAAAVAAVGGSERAGQVEMAEAVAAAMASGEHLLVQAGTGTGKSLAYLVPALLHAVERGAGRGRDRHARAAAPARRA